MKLLFNDGWSFMKQPLEGNKSTSNEMSVFFNSNKWKPVDIPHDWMIYDTKNLYEEAIGCYKKTFFVDTKHENIFLRFEGVYMDTTIYLNQIEIFVWKYGYSTFDVNLTGLLADGENEIIVKTVYQLPNSRWYPGSGIYRNVWLITKPSTYFVLDGSYISTEKTGEHWNIFVDIEIMSKEQTLATLSHTIYDVSGKSVATSKQNIFINNNLTIDKQVIPVSHPKIWDIKTPNLYTITSELIVNNHSIDSLTQNIGFRTIHFDSDKGFFLNDRNVKINGVCQHHDLGSLGSAMNKTALRRQFTILKEMGVNSVRSAHNMPSVEFMELADEMGLLVYTESFDMWERKKTDYDYGNYFSEWWERDLTSWIRRDRNHPSLFIWGIGNEVYDTHFDRGLEITKMLHEAVIALDPRKNAVTALGSNYISSENAQRCSDIVDLSGYNYMEKFYDEHHVKYPHWCIFGSETSSTVQSRSIYHFPSSNRLLTYDDLQCSSLFNCTTNWGARTSFEAIINHRDRKYCFGQYLWVGWDYLGEPTPYFTKNSYFGQIDTAGFKKDTFYAYQSEWTNDKDAPMIHLLPYWDFNEGQLIDVMIVSNAPKVELFFQREPANSKLESLGTFMFDHQKGKELIAKWQIPYEKGLLRAVAYDEADQILCSDEQKSFGDPVAIHLIPDKKTLLGNGEDLLFIEIQTLDADHNFVANSRSRMNVSVTGAGRLIGLDNGDSTDYDQYKGTSRKLFGGRLLAIIAAKCVAGDIYINVTSPLLKTAALTLKAIEAPYTPGISCAMENELSPENTEVNKLTSDEIPIRKISLINHGINHFDSDNTTTSITAKIYPENATYTDIIFKALTLNGIESNCVKIIQEGNTATLIAGGNGTFRLCASANNGLDHPEVLSELEFDITGMGDATLDPFHFISAIDYTKSNFDLPLSFQGGVYITTNERTILSFDNVDFGDYGSDEIHLPIFSFHDMVPIEVWDGIPDKEGRMLLKDEYKAKSWYNHYQENVYQLDERLQGIHTISVVVTPTVKMSLQGFRFTYIEKAFGKIYATENTRITGDMFTVGEDIITNIGNNVTIEFENMNFGTKGCTSLMICGRSHTQTNTIHIHFIDEDETDVTQLIDVSCDDDMASPEEKIFPLNKMTGKKKVNFLFMPGSKFDLKYFQFS